MSSELLTVQSYLQNYLLTRDDKIKDFVSGSSDDFLLSRLAIYGEGYRLRLIDSLKEDHPKLIALLGEAGFEEIASDYITQHPSRSFTIIDLGKNFYSFLKTTEPYSNNPELGELAQFEWLLSEAIDKSDQDYLTIESVSKIPQEAWPEILFYCHPSFSLTLFHFTVAECKLTRFGRPVYYGVWRNRLFQSCHSAFTDCEAFILRALQDRKTFGTICEDLCEFIPEDEVAEFTVKFIIRLLHDQILTGFEIEPQAR